METGGRRDSVSDRASSALGRGLESSSLVSLLTAPVASHSTFMNSKCQLGQRGGFFSVGLSFVAMVRVNLLNCIRWHHFPTYHLLAELSSANTDASFRWHQPSLAPKTTKADNPSSLSSTKAAAYASSTPSAIVSSALILPPQFDFPFSQLPASSYLSQNYICETGEGIAGFLGLVICWLLLMSTFLKLITTRSFFLTSAASRLLFQSITWIKNVPSFALLMSDVQTTILRHTWAELLLLGEFVIVW